MSLFMQNLIMRHQEGGSGMLPLVQPRPKARFENDQGSTHWAGNGFEQRKKASYIEEGHAGTSDTSSSRSGNEAQSRGTPFQPPLRSEQVVTDIPNRHQPQPFLGTDPPHQSNALQGRNEGRTVQVENRVAEQGNLSWAGKNRQTEPAPAFFSATKPPAEGILSTDPVQQQIQKILHRLQEERQESGEPSGHLRQQENGMPPAFASDKLEQPAMPSSQVADPIPTEDRKEPRTQPLQPEIQQAGLLQPPPWLAAMQAELSSRWQTSTPQAETEPVVNVTIGRVEVRAVQAKSTSKPETRQKLSGVMSLNEYLKQREKRG